MANEEHLKLLQQGVETWNQWRAMTSPLQPDLSEADLHDANLSRANLSRAILIRANLNGTNLSEANLDGANLRGAELRRTNLTHASLSEADLSGTMMQETLLGNINLPAIRGLETVIHLGPSVVGVETLYQAEGEISKIFLQRAGVPTDLMGYIERTKPFVSSFTREQIDYWLINLQRELFTIMKNIGQLKMQRVGTTPADVSLKTQQELAWYEAEQERVETEIIKLERLKRDD